MRIRTKKAPEKIISPVHHKYVYIYSVYDFEINKNKEAVFLEYSPFVYFSLYQAATNATNTHIHEYARYTNDGRVSKFCDQKQLKNHFIAVHISAAANSTVKIPAKTITTVQKKFLFLIMLLLPVHTCTKKAPEKIISPVHHKFFTLLVYLFLRIMKTII